MARPSKVRTNIARLRLNLGKSQSEFALLIRRSVACVQSLELARLKLSTELAGEISRRTAVHPRWLLENNLEESAYDLTGNPWTLASYTRLRDEIPHHVLQGDDVMRQRMLELATQLSLARNLAAIKRLYRALENGGQVVEIGRRIDQFLTSLMIENNVHPDQHMMEEVRYAERESDRKTQNVLRVAGVATTPSPAMALQRYRESMA
jgi:hypothetical protein